MASIVGRMFRFTRTLPFSTFGVQRVPHISLFSSDFKIFTPDMEPPIPPYQQRSDESVDLKRARLLYQSRKRGMLENGLLLSTFAAKYLDSLNESQLQLYDKLINQPTNDWEIYYWVTGAKSTPEEYDSEVLDMLKEHAQNKDRDSRIRQPDLYSS